MNEWRDPELQRVLRTLSVPDHGAEFWTRLDDALAQERPPGETPRMSAETGR